MSDAPGVLQVRITPIPGGLRVHVQGEENYPNTVAYWRQLAHAARTSGTRRVLLIDALQGEPLTEAQWLQLVVSMAGTGIERLRIAHVKPPGAHEVAYCEIYARDAGIDARAFADEASAHAWLAAGD